MTEHANNRQSVLEQPLHPTDREQTTHTVEVLSDGGPLEPQEQRPDLVNMTEEEVATLPTNLVK